MDINNLSDPQFNHLLNILIQYKKCCPDKEVFLNHKSFKKACDYFIKTGVFNDHILQENNIGENN